MKGLRGSSPFGSHRMISQSRYSSGRQCHEWRRPPDVFFGDVPIVVQSQVSRKIGVVLENRARAHQQTAQILASWLDKRSTGLT
jgi:hypothetical protein